MGPEEFRCKTAIVGVGTTRFRDLYRNLDPERSAYDLAVEAFKSALDDAGLRNSDIDGILLGRITNTQRICEMTGVARPRLAPIGGGGGRHSAYILQYAAMAVHTGLANYVACFYGNNGRSVRVRYGGEDEAASSLYDTLFGMTSPGAGCALLWQAYMDEYGATPEQLAAIPIAFRKHAHLNPNAVMSGRELTLDDYIKARFIAEPLRLNDYCLVNDGGVCFIITTAERARALKKPPVYIAGTASCASYPGEGFGYANADYIRGAERDVASRIYKNAGVSQNDVRCLEIYDNFSPFVLFSYEGFGFSPPGEAGAWIQGGQIELGGRWPTNTCGGHLSESYQQGWALQVEGARQVRGEAGSRQVPNCDVLQYICPTPGVSSHIFTKHPV